MSHRNPLDGRAAGLMFLLCIIWSLQQIVLKAAAPDMAPIMQIALRSAFAAIMVVGMLYKLGRRIVPVKGTLVPGLLAGFLFGLEYLLVGEGLRLTTASHIVVFLYTAPCFAALGLYWRLPEERLRPLQWMGMALAFCGIALAFYNPSSAPRSEYRDMLLGDLLGLLAGMAWGATTVVVRCSKLSDIPASQTVLYQLIGAFILLIAASLALNQVSFDLTPMVWGSLLFQTVVVSFASLLIWFWLLRRYLASRLGVLSFLTPVFGVVFGVILLNEKVEAQFLLGSLLVLAGIILVSGYSWIKNLWPTPHGKK